jgi:hypothetical protein
VPAGQRSDGRPRLTGPGTNGSRRPRLLFAARSDRASVAASSVITPDLPQQVPAPGGEVLPSSRLRVIRRGLRPQQDGSPAEQRGRSWRTSASSVLRQHWLAALLLAAGAALRVVTEMAYHPAILYVDSLKYLYGAWPGSDPLGYKALLNSVLVVGDLGTVAAVQHLLGLAMAVALYVLLLRRGVNRWLAALAIAPVLLDAYQLQAEEMIMPDVFFEALVVLALVILLWKPTVSWVAAIAAGLILGAAVTVHEFGLVLIVPTVAYLLAARGGPIFSRDNWPEAIKKSMALGAAFALPVFVYCSVFYVERGHFRLAAGRPSIPRLAQAADCATLRLPAAARPLCPTPAEQRESPDWFQHDPLSPLLTIAVRGPARQHLYHVFDSAVEHQQPQRVVAAVLRDAIRLYEVDRTNSLAITPILRWQFQTTYPDLLPNINIRPNGDIILGLQYRLPCPIHYQLLKPSYGGKAQVDRSLAGFLRGYQLHGGYTPGPLLLIFTLAGLAGSVLALVSRRSSARGRKLALACLVFFVSAVGLLLISDIYVFSWRYQLQALTTLPPAGVLGVSAALDAFRRRKPASVAGPASP